MKTCGWCGRDNADEATRCLECGSEIGGVAKEAKAARRGDWSWIKVVCGYGGAAFLVVLLYFLSLGPVTRFSATTSETTTRKGNSFTFQRTVSYPGWVGIVYYPAFSLTDNGPHDAVTELYWRYLHWWEPPPTNK